MIINFYMLYVIVVHQIDIYRSKWQDVEIIMEHRVLVQVLNPENLSRVRG